MVVAIGVFVDVDDEAEVGVAEGVPIGTELLEDPEHEEGGGLEGAQEVHLLPPVLTELLDLVG